MLRLRVAAFANSYPPHVSGVATYLATMRRYLERVGVDVLVVAPGDADVPIQVVGERYGHPVPADLSGHDIARIDAFAPQVVWLHHFAGLGASGLRYGAARGLPSLYHWHTRYDDATWAASRMPGAPAWTGHLASATFANGCQACVVPTAEIHDLAVASGVRSLYVAPGPVEPLAVDVASERARWGIAPRTWAFCGRLSVEKGLAWLAEVARARPDWHGIIVGDGPERATLAGLPNLRLLGALPHREARAVVAACDAFLFPSRFDTQGLAPIEAMSSGVPAIAADCPVMREIGCWTAATPRAMSLALGAVTAASHGPEARRRAARFAPERVVPMLLEALVAAWQAPAQRRGRQDRLGAISQAAWLGDSRAPWKQAAGHALAFAQALGGRAHRR